MGCFAFSGKCPQSRFSKTCVKSRAVVCLCCILKNLRDINCKVDPLIFAFTKTLISNRLVHLFTRPRVFDRERNSRGPTSIKVVWLRASTQSKTSTIVELHFWKDIPHYCYQNSPALKIRLRPKFACNRNGIQRQTRISRVWSQKQNLRLYESTWK